MAQPTCVEMQKVIAGVSGMNTASMRLAIRELDHELPGSVDRPKIGIYGGCDNFELSKEPRSEILREIGHPLEIDDATPVNPAVELARVETLVPSRFERFLEFWKIQLREIETRSSHLCYHTPVLLIPCLSMVCGISPQSAGGR
jgi:hypothetical protein